MVVAVCVCASGAALALPSVRAPSSEVAACGRLPRSEDGVFDPHPHEAVHKAGTGDNQPRQDLLRPTCLHKKANASTREEAVVPPWWHPSSPSPRKNHAFVAFLSTQVSLCLVTQVSQRVSCEKRATCVLRFGLWNRFRNDENATLVARVKVARYPCDA